MRSAVVMVAGVLMLLSSVAHGALGWPAMSSALKSAGAPANLIGALGAGWYFGSASMAAFGVIVLLAGLRWRRGDPSGITAVRVIAACYLIFGVSAFVIRDFNPHFLLFVVTGVLAGGPVAGRGLARDHSGGAAA